MREKLKAYVETLFEQAPNTPAVRELRDEILMNSLDRFDEEVAAGQSEEAAFAAAKDAIGDIHELLDPLCPQKKKEKSGGKIVLAILSVCLLIALVVSVLLWVFAPRFSGLGFYREEDYVAMENDDSVTLENDISGISIHWSSGEVLVSAYDGKEVVLRETGADKDGDRLRYRVDNGVLTIQERQSGVSFHAASKTLEILVPTKDLNFVAINVSSADVRVTGMKGMSLELDTSSGGVFVSDCRFRHVEVNCASGNAELNGSFDGVEFESASGNLTLVSSVAPKEISVNTASGDVTLTLPADADFSLEFDTASGEWDIQDFVGSLRGEQFVCGNGVGDYEIETASGDLTLHAG